MRPVELSVAKNGEEVLRLSLRNANLTVGSAAHNDIVIPDASMPEVAAVLSSISGHLRVEDLSEGRVTLNGVSLGPNAAALTPEDVLSLGAFSLRWLAPKNTEVRKTKALPGPDPVPGARLRYRDEERALSPVGVFHIGSAEDNDLVINDDFVSGFHCKITGQGGTYRIEDLGSTNGTWVNGVKVSESTLPTQASIKLGRPELSFGSAVEPPSDRYGMVGTSTAMRAVFDRLERFAPTDEPVLVVGESGTGKELIARALHDASGRSGPFLALNCGAFTESLIESELFGHEKHAFTGASTTKAGAFEATENGTLFLDEIGELPRALQPKLLRALEARAIRRLGGTQERPCNTRIVAATHQNLEANVKRGDFREDLFHRLYVLSLRLPALREREDDVLQLASRFLTASTHPKRLSPGAASALKNHAWPGNVRELRNVLVRAMLMSDHEELQESDLEFVGEAFSAPTDPSDEPDERGRLLKALEETGGNRAEAARRLGFSKSTFHDRLRRYGIPLKVRDHEWVNRLGPA